MTSIQTRQTESEKRELGLVAISWIQIASRAPSADNLQPWATEIQCQSEKIAILVSVNAVTLQNPCEMDANFSTSYIALGSFARNLEIAATKNNYRLEGIQKIDGSGVTTSFQLVFEPNATGFSEPQGRLLSWIAKRRTDRLPWKTMVLDPAHQVALTVIGKSLSETQMRYLPVNQCQSAIRTISRVDVMRYVHKKFFLSLLDKFRFGQEAQETQNGLADVNLGIPSLFSASFAMMRRFKFLWVLNFFGSQFFSAWYGCTRLLKRSSGLITLQGASNSPLGWFKLGFDLQQVWLELTAQNISVQPVGTTLILHRAYLEEMGTLEEKDMVLSPKQVSKLRLLRKQLEEQLQVCVDRPLVVLRVGYALAPSVEPASLRGPTVWK
jgi:hypothetical protein